MEKETLFTSMYQLTTAVKKKNMCIQQKKSFSKSLELKGAIQRQNQFLADLTKTMITSKTRSSETLHRVASRPLQKKSDWYHSKIISTLNPQTWMWLHLLLRLTPSRSRPHQKIATKTNRINYRPKERFQLFIWTKTQRNQVTSIKATILKVNKSIFKSLMNRQKSQINSRMKNCLHSLRVAIIAANSQSRKSRYAQVDAWKKQLKESERCQILYHPQIFEIRERTHSHQEREKVPIWQKLIFRLMTARSIIKLCLCRKSQINRVTSSRREAVVKNQIAYRAASCLL